MAPAGLLEVGSGGTQRVMGGDQGALPQGDQHVLLVWVGGLPGPPTRVGLVRREPGPDSGFVVAGEESSFGPVPEVALEAGQNRSGMDTVVGSGGFVGGEVKQPGAASDGVVAVAAGQAEGGNEQSVQSGSGTGAGTDRGRTAPVASWAGGTVEEEQSQVDACASTPKLASVDAGAWGPCCTAWQRPGGSAAGAGDGRVVFAADRGGDGRSNAASYQSALSRNSCCRLRHGLAA